MKMPRFKKSDPEEIKKEMQLIYPMLVEAYKLQSGYEPAGNVFAMSIFYNNFINQTSGSILITTILSTFTVPLTLYLLLN